MAQVKATFLATSGLQNNMADTDTLRLVATPAAEVDAANKKYVDDSDAAVAQGAQDANDALQSTIEGEIGRLDEADSTLQSNIDAEEAARIAGDQLLADMIENGASDGNERFVQRDGDNMLGTLTFGTDNVSIDTTGNGIFSNKVEVRTGTSYLENGVELDKAGTVKIGNLTGTDTPVVTVYDGTYETINLGNKGTATFTGDVSCHAASITTPDATTDYARIYNAGYFYANRVTDNATIFEAHKGTATPILMDNEGNATFTGTLEANKIDGGTYAV